MYGCICGPLKPPWSQIWVQYSLFMISCWCAQSLSFNQVIFPRNDWLVFISSKLPSYRVLSHPFILYRSVIHLGLDLVSQMIGVRSSLTKSQSIQIWILNMLQLISLQMLWLLFRRYQQVWVKGLTVSRIDSLQFRMRCCTIHYLPPLPPGQLVILLRVTAYIC